MSVLIYGEKRWLLQVSEIVYVHSKLMIVDDRITVIGSGELLCNNKYRLNHGGECHTGYNGTVVTSAHGTRPRAEAVTVPLYTGLAQEDPCFNLFIAWQFT